MDTNQKRWLSRVERKIGWALKDAPAWIQNDRDVVRAAIERNPTDETIEYAIKQTGWALEYAPDRMKNDPVVVIDAVTKSGAALRYASDNLRASDEIIDRAVRQEPTALQFALGGKNQSVAKLKATGVFDDIAFYDSNKPRVVLSTRFSLGENTSATATIFALLMKKNMYFQKFNVYFPNAYNKSTCDPEWTNIKHKCRGTFETCEKEPEFKTGVPQEHKSCWRYSYRYQLETGLAMVQIVEYYYAGESAGNSEELQKAEHVIGNGQNIETEMAKMVGIKVFRCFQPVDERGNKAEFDESVMEDIAQVIETWYEEDPNNREECNLHWKRALGKWWLQQEDNLDLAALSSGDRSNSLKFDAEKSLTLTDVTEKLYSEEA